MATKKKQDATAALWQSQLGQRTPWISEDGRSRNAAEMLVIDGKLVRAKHQDLREKAAATIKSIAIECFQDNLELKDNMAHFRRTVVSQIMARTGCSPTAAATHYTNALNACKTLLNK